jgi:hypothetical protein
MKVEQNLYKLIIILTQTLNVFTKSGHWMAGVKEWVEYVGGRSEELGWKCEYSMCGKEVKGGGESVSKVCVGMNWRAGVKVWVQYVGGRSEWLGWKC